MHYTCKYSMIHTCYLSLHYTEPLLIGIHYSALLFYCDWCSCSVLSSYLFKQRVSFDHVIGSNCWNYPIVVRKLSWFFLPQLSWNDAKCTWYQNNVQILNKLQKSLFQNCFLYCVMSPRIFIPRFFEPQYFLVLVFQKGELGENVDDIWKLSFVYLN